MTRSTRLAVFSVGAVGLLGVAIAQTPATVDVSIEDAIRRAEARSEEVQIARAGVGRADAEKVRARSEWLPQVNASLGYQRLLRSQFDAIDQGGPVVPGGDGGVPLTQPDDGLTLFDLFAAPSTYRADLTVSQNLFAGGRTVARQQLAEASRTTALVGLESARAQAVLDTVQAYYDAVLSDQLLSIAEATFRQAEATLEQTKLGAQNGTRPEFDLLRAQVAFENQRPVVLQRRTDRDLARLRLKQILEVPLERELRLTSSLDDTLQDLSPVAREVTGAPAPQGEEADRAAVRQARELVEMREAGVKIARSQHYPQVNVSSTFGLTHYAENYLPNFDQLGLTQRTRDNWTVGVAVQIPIFSGFRVTGDVDSARHDLIEAQARLRQAEELARVDARSARQQLASAEVAWRASSGVVEQARKAWEIAQIRYREGVSTQLELADAQILFEQAQANRARAARDLQVARVRITLLPFLPVTPAGFASGAAAGAMGQAPASGAAGMGAGAPAGAAGAGAGGAAQGGGFGF